MPRGSNRKNEVESYYLRNIVIRFLGNAWVELNESLSNVLTACSRPLDLAPLTLDKKFKPNTHEKLIESKC